MKRFLTSMTLLFSVPMVMAGSAPLNPELTLYENGFSGAVAIRHAGDGSNRLFIVQQGGAIRVIDANGDALPTAFLNIDPLTSNGAFGEGGLLGLAFHPDYSNNGFFYINYLDNDGDTMIVRYSVSQADPNVADPNSALTILTVDQDFDNHNGGDIHFGPDGYLYIGFGDGGSGNDPCNRGQTKDPNNLNSNGSCAADGNFNGNNDSRALLGSMIRIDVDNPGTNVGDACGEGVNYGIPADNPFSDANADCGEIYAWGLRNPYRYSFDRQTGDMFIGDVGQGAREEVDLLPAASAGGENYGWVCREGFIPTPGISCTVTDAVDPIIDYNRSGGACSVIGGYVYRGEETTWTGTYIYSDFCTNTLYWSVNQGGGNWSSRESLISTVGSVRGFGEDEQGNLYLSTSNAIYQLTDADFVSDVIFADNFDN